MVDVKKALHHWERRIWGVRQFFRIPKPHVDFATLFGDLRVVSIIHHEITIRRTQLAYGLIWTGHLGGTPLARWRIAILQLGGVGGVGRQRTHSALALLRGMLQLRHCLNKV